MKTYNIASLNVKMKIHYPLLEKQAEKYLSTFADEKCDISLELPLSFYEQRKKENDNLSLEEIEYIFLGNLFYNKLLDFDGFLLHSSSINYKNNAILFSAFSGVGKSTHVSMWQKLYPNDVLIINDDKPAIRKIDDTFYCCGTPFSGKNDLSNNILVPLKALVFIKRAPTNSIRKMEKLEALKCILEQTIRTMNKERMNVLTDLLDKFITIIPIYELSCDISTSAAELVHDTLFKNENL